MILLFYAFDLITSFAILLIPPFRPAQALNLLNNVYGAMHPEIAACLRLLARLNYIMGEFGEVCQAAELFPLLAFTYQFTN